MTKRFTKPFWNVRIDSVEKTTLGAEQVARRFETGRGYLVSAENAKEARRIVTMYQFDTRYCDEGKRFERVARIDCGRAIVLKAA